MVAASSISRLIPMYYEERQYPVNGDVTVFSPVSGPVFEGITVEKRFGRSRFRQEIRSYHTVPRVDFITHVRLFRRQRR